MISYEVSIGVIIINVLLCVGSLNLTDIVLAQKKIWFVVPLLLTTCDDKCTLNKISRQILELRLA